jgi:hypothetical protein
MKYLKVQKVDELLKNADKPMLIKAQIIEHIVTLRNPPYNLIYQMLNIYLSSITTFSAMNDVSLNRKRITRYLGEPTVAHRGRAYATEEGSVNLPSADSNMKKC